MSGREGKSDKRYVPELEIISKKYPNAIITLNSAFYYYGLTDTIPDFYYVATPKNTRKISDERVKQFYENSEAFDMGKTRMNYDGVVIVLIFVLLLVLDSPYLNWDYNDPEFAVVGVVFHAFEWIFIRLAPITLIGAMLELC